MPTIIETSVTAYAHCTDPRCPGAYQQPVDGRRIETGWAYTENGGDIPGIERSHVRAEFADPQDAVCPHCSGPRDIALDPRPQYQNLSGKDPMGLLGIAAFDPSKPLLADPGTTAELDALKAQVAELAAALKAKETSD